MAKRLIIKTNNDNGIPSNWEMCHFEQKHGVTVNEVPRLYVTYKVGKRRKLKRLRINVISHPCEMCGYHRYASGSVGKVEFNKEIF